VVVASGSFGNSDAAMRTTSLPVSAHVQGAGALAYCKDVARLCKGIPPGGGKLIGCLKQHENQVSVGCAKELKAVKTKMGK
jgi:hypothetical protein